MPSFDTDVSGCRVPSSLRQTKAITSVSDLEFVAMAPYLSAAQQVFTKHSLPRALRSKCSWSGVDVVGSRRELADAQLLARKNVRRATASDIEHFYIMNVATDGS